MATEWAGRYQQPQNPASARPTPADQLLAWLSLERLVLGRSVPHWALVLFAVCVLGAGPSSLGYIFLALAVYRIYTLHQAGHTAAGLWEEFSQSNAAASGKQQQKKKRGGR